MELPVPVALALADAGALVDDALQLQRLAHSPIYERDEQAEWRREACALLDRAHAQLTAARQELPLSSRLSIARFWRGDRWTS